METYGILVVGTWNTVWVVTSAGKVGHGNTGGYPFPEKDGFDQTFQTFSTDEEIHFRVPFPFSTWFFSSFVLSLFNCVIYRSLIGGVLTLDT